MTLRKKIILSLLIIPLSLILLILIRPVTEGDQHNQLELIFLIAGVPIFVLNYLEWVSPQILTDLGGYFKLPFENRARTADDALANHLPGSQPAWKLFAILTCVLVLGIALGAGALSAFNQKNAQSATANLDATPGKEQPNIVGITTTLPEAFPSETATRTPPPSLLPQTSTPLPSPIGGVSATVSSSLPSETPTSGPTADVNRCLPPTQKQLAAIQAGVKIINTDNEIRKGYAVQSIAADNLWFFAAKIYGPDFDGGSSSEPAVWSFYNTNDTPFNIYTINETAFQYSNFNFGGQASPLIDMRIDGAENAYECAAAGN